MNMTGGIYRNFLLTADEDIQFRPLFHITEISPAAGYQCLIPDAQCFAAFKGGDADSVDVSAVAITVQRNKLGVKEYIFFVVEENLKYMLFAVKHKSASLISEESVSRDMVAPAIGGTCRRPAGVGRVPSS